MRAQALLPLIPAGTEVLLMLDGRAQAMLYTLGRNARLPTIVAKNEIKSYMKSLSRGRHKRARDYA